MGAPAKNSRLLVDAVLYRYRCGIAWRDLPQRFGDFRVVHLRHMRWSRSGVWLRVFEALSALPDNEYAMIDATIVRAHQHSAGAKRGQSQAIGRSRGGLSTKIHATVDALGNPTGFHLTAGQASDLEGADVWLARTDAQAVIADKAYDAHERVVEPLLRQGKQVVIPSIRTCKTQRGYDRNVYQERHLIENFSARLKQYRGIATRYDKTAAAFLGGIHLAAAVVWLN